MEDINSSLTPEASRPTVRFDIDYPERSSRWLALATLLLMIPKGVMLIPHLVILYILSFLSLIVVIIAQFAVLFTGRYPRGMFDLVAGILRWQTRVSAYICGLTDTYPPFTTK